VEGEYMSQFLVWTEEELGVGVYEMDREHQQLIARMNKVYELKNSTHPM
jgi:hemerythrin